MRGGGGGGGGEECCELGFVIKGIKHVCFC